MKFLQWKIGLTIFLIGIISLSSEVLSQPAQPATFQLRVPEGVKSVHVVGDFNNWSATANPMSDDDRNRLWELSLNLPFGEYQYRFLINGKIWTKDPANYRWGGKNSNSIIIVPDPRVPRLEDVRPESGSVIRGRDFEVTAYFVDGAERNGINGDSIQVVVDDVLYQANYIETRSLIRCPISGLAEGEHRITIRAAENGGLWTRPESLLVVINAHNESPIAEAGYTQIVGIGNEVTLSAGLSYDPDHDPLTQFKWRILHKPRDSKISLANSRSPFPRFVPDKEGRYLFGLRVSDRARKSPEDTVDVFARIKRKYPTLFELDTAALAETYKKPIRSIHVAGEFNCWSPTDLPMTDLNKDGVWTAWLELEPGEYEYKFVLNKEHWIADPNNPIRVPDGWEGFNSVKLVRLNLAPVAEVEARLRPGFIILDASKSYSKTGKVLSFSWYQDINNPQKWPLLGQQQLRLPMPRISGTYYFHLVVTDNFGSSTRKTITLKVDRGKIQVTPFSKSPDWAQDAIIYKIFVRKFTSEGTLKGVVEKLPYLKELGVNCLWLMPIFESPTDQGYASSNFFQIEKDYGTETDLRELVRASHRAGIRIILDFTANGSSDQHPYFVSAFRNPHSIYRNWYRWTTDISLSHLMPYEYHNNLDQFPNFNYDNPLVRNYILSVAKYWMSFDIDGYCSNVGGDVPHNFWKDFRRQTKEINPDFLLVNEMFPRSPAYHQDEFDMSHDTDFYVNLLDVMRGRKPLSAIDYGLQKTKRNYPPHTLNLRYLENQDIERFISQFGIKKTQLAAALLFTIPGTPMIYYGQEIGLSEKCPPMDWENGDRELFQYYKTLISLRRRHVALKRGEMLRIPTDQEESVYAYLRRSQNQLFIVILNFADKPLQCKLKLPEGLFEPGQIDRWIFKDMLTDGKKVLWGRELRTKVINLEPIRAYVFKAVQKKL